MRRALLALVTALVAAACTAAPDAPVDPAVVRVWFHAGQGSERATLEAQALVFNAATPDVQVDVSLRPEGDYDAFVREAGAAGDLPCLLDLDGPFLASYVDAGFLRPLDDLLPDDVVDDLLPSIDAQGTYDGARYAVGTFDSGLALWGNRAHLEAADVRIPTGLSEAWSLRELEEEVLPALQALPEVQHALDLKTNYSGEWFTYGVLPFVWDFGGDVLAEDGEVDGAMDAPATVAALDYLRRLVDAGYVDPAAATDDAFYGTRTASLAWVGHWMYPAHRSALGDDLVLLPAPVGPEGHATGMGSWQWGVTSACDEPEAAAEFLTFLLDPEEVLRMTEANGAVPAREAAVAASALYGPEGPLRLLADQLTEGVARPRPVTPTYPAITRAFAGAVQDVLAGADPAERLAAAAADVERER